ncbi:hypothetical protein PRUB_a3363 [Pseudoalteromonas rubra]|uniref:Uncharacterized protein n=1 Tax=Pseudoalteromonas rubra TaxID=43658 RepID=A0A8T0C2W2_9GAMM|nr:hypothetical protein PRUB_a3363 [Pseudoalteromonas rubra]
MGIKIPKLVIMRMEKWSDQNMSYFYKCFLMKDYLLISS